MGEAKPETSGLVGIVAKGAGAFVGTAAVAGKRIRRCVRNMLAVEEAPSKPAAKEPVRAPAKRKGPQPQSGETRPKAVRAQAQKKTARRKRSTPPETSAARKQP